MKRLTAQRRRFLPWSATPRYSIFLPFFSFSSSDWFYQITTHSMHCPIRRLFFLGTKQKIHCVYRWGWFQETPKGIAVLRRRLSYTLSYLSWLCLSDILFFWALNFGIIWSSFGWAGLQPINPTTKTIFVYFGRLSPTLSPHPFEIFLFIYLLL